MERTFYYIVQADRTPDNFIMLPSLRRGKGWNVFDQSSAGNGAWYFLGQFPTLALFEEFILFEEIVSAEI